MWFRKRDITCLLEKNDFIKSDFLERDLKEGVNEDKLNKCCLDKCEEEVQNRIDRYCVNTKKNQVE